MHIQVRYESALPPTNLLPCIDDVIEISDNFKTDSYYFDVKTQKLSGFEFQKPGDDGDYGLKSLQLQVVHENGRQQIRAADTVPAAVVTIDASRVVPYENPDGGGRYEGVCINQGYADLGGGGFVASQSYSDAPSHLVYQRGSKSQTLVLPPGSQALTVSEANSLGFSHPRLLWTVSEIGCTYYQNKWFGACNNFPYAYAQVIPLEFGGEDGDGDDKKEDEGGDGDEGGEGGDGVVVAWVVVASLVVIIGFFLWRRRARRTNASVAEIAEIA
jgi:hypothetical protein